MKCSLVYKATTSSFIQWRGEKRSMYILGRYAYFDRHILPFFNGSAQTEYIFLKKFY